jgi:hypothetical protein
MMSLKRSLIMMVASLLIPIPSLIGLGKTESPSTCAVIDKEAPSLYLTFVRMDDEEGIWLRLFNNLSCGVVVRTGDLIRLQKYQKLFKPRVSKTTGGEILTEHLFQWPSEGVVTIPIVYQIEGEQHQKEPDLADDQVYSFDLPPQRSVIFRVYADHFRRGSGISVAFTYEWESHPGREPLNHRVFFYKSQLPEAAIKKLKEESDEKR